MNLKKFLKPIKKNLKNRDRPFLTIRQLYTHLSDFSNNEILDYYNVKTIQELEQHIAYIKDILKNQRQNYKEELEQISGCFCMDGNGAFKYLYQQKIEAEKQIEHSFKNKKVKLTLYPCPYHNGWHLKRI